MRNVSNCIAGLFVLACLFSCQTKPQAPSNAQPLSLEQRTVRQQKGSDCDKQPDSLRTDCATIDFSVPQLQGTGAPSALANNINAWTDKFLIRLLSWSDYNQPGKGPQTLDAAIQRFRALHDENTGSVFSGMFKASCSGSALLNNGQYLTLLLDGFSFQGGNRALQEVAIATFDVATGKQLTLDQLVKDKAALRLQAQALLRETRADAFSEGFDVDPSKPFVLPESYGLSPEGLVLHYQPDEIEHLGGATEFTIPYSNLGANLRVFAPIPTPVDTTILSIYEQRGNRLIIPPFEIELNTSTAANRTLAKKKENIIVSAMFWSLPIDPREKAKGDEGFVIVADKNIELSGDARVARFEGLSFDKSLLSKMEDRDINLLINVFSARKSSPDNLLNGDILEARATQFANKRFVLRCKLIAEPERHGSSAAAAAYPEACYALPAADAEVGGPLNFLVDCSEAGEILFAGRPMQHTDALMAALRPLLVAKIKKGVKPDELPGIETAGCLMGSSGAIRDAYEALKTELTTTKSKPASPKTATAAKPAVAAARTSVTLKQNGEMLVNGKKVPDIESLRKVLQDALLQENVIPDKLSLQTVGETGMGMRAELNTIIAEAITGAKWLRKKGALAALNQAVGKKLGIATQLEPGNYQSSGNFAYLSARPKQANGKAIDYSKTSYATEAAAGTLADNSIGLLQYDKGVWKVLAYSIGVNQPPVDVWVKRYKAPRALFNTASSVKKAG
ncbi:MAG: DUF3298 domain-containing protein [Saprospiraceae bacterium]|nr:DUF3298 domain-containing protein [Saprospiraceae bacterium]